MNTILSNREIAILIWLILFIAFALYHTEKKSITDISKPLLEAKIISPILLSIIYTGGIIYLLKLVSLWDEHLLKDSVLWFLFIGLPLIFKFATHENQIRIFKKVFFENFKLILIAEFVINFYTFPLLVELILIPFLSFMAISEIITDQKEKYKSAANFFSNLNALAGLSILAYALYKVVENWNSFTSFSTLQTFILPILLTILYLPFLYLLVLYANYDTLFIRLEVGANKSDELKWEAKKTIFKNCLFSVNKTQRAKNMSIYNLMSIRSKSDLEEMDKIYQQEL